MGPIMVNVPVHSPSNRIFDCVSSSFSASLQCCCCVEVATQINIVVLGSVMRASHVDKGSCASASYTTENAAGATLKAWSLKARNLVARAERRVVLGVVFGRGMVVYVVVVVPMAMAWIWCMYVFVNICT